ncbi:MAG: efflux RND transporter periplasmic adaptor subunit [candidate division Zixibacteria bacterium]|jgi:HlyD family secretion protein|nr:efflux RND transporter periplasmic adaptor subunit [candidate division Zixibacteria bacterium]
MSYRYHGLACILAVSLAAILTGCADTDNTGAGSGLIEADEVIVSAETAGRLLARHFDEGSVVRGGDTLAVIDTTRLVLQIEAARAGRAAAEARLNTARVQLAQAKQTESFAETEFNRVSRLLSSGTATQRQFDQVQHEYNTSVNARKTIDAQIRAIEAELEQVDAQIATIEREYRDCFPVAPSPGTVTEAYVDAGELLAPGKAIARIARLDTVWVKVYLPAGKFAHVTIGQTATINTESGGQTYEGRVVWTADEAEFTPKNVQTEESRADLVYAVKVLAPNPDGTLKVGMPVFVTMELP